MGVRAFMFGQCCLGRLRLPGRPFPGCTALPSPSTMSGADSLMVFSLPFGGAYLGLVPQEPPGPPPFLALLPTPTTLLVDPDRPPGRSPKRVRCVGFWGVNTLARCLLLVPRLSQAWGSADYPTGYVVPWVRFNCFVRLYIAASSTVATLGMSGWLDLAQRGLAPHKKRHASLGARRVGQEPRGSFPPSERSVRLSPHCAQA